PGDYALHDRVGDELPGAALAAAGLADDADTDLVLLCVPAGEGETALADAAGAYLSRRTASGELGWLPPVDPGDAPSVLAELAAAAGLGAPVVPAAAR
ncbi:MAG TPA: hypothetical protein VN213_13510, partial [Solirubrobacteraceae bacterium]|nr:hypothetical protein [Solirubrobacteraceae bacterium]